MSELYPYIKRLLWLALMFCCCILVAGSVCSLLSQVIPEGATLYRAQSAVQAAIGFIPAAWLAVRKFNPHPWRYMGLTANPGLRPFIGVVVFMAIAMPFLNWTVQLNEAVTFPESLSGLEAELRAFENAAQRLTETMLSSASVGGLIANVLVIGVLTGFAEETIFRGATQRMVASTPYLHGNAAVWITAIIFSAAHFQFFGFLPRMLLGAFLGYLFYSTRSLWPSVFAHALNNSLVVLSVWFADRGDCLDFLRTAGYADSGTIPYVALASALATALFCIFAWRYFFSPDNSKING